MRRTALAAGLALVVLAAGACSEKKPQPAADPGHASTPPGHSTGPPGSASASAPVSPQLARQLADARAATTRYVTDLAAAQKDGYQLITKMMPDMGFHYLNSSISGFDVTKPAILVYVKNGTQWQLGALEWVFPEAPATPPLEGATYGSFDAACHYKDGTFIPAAAEADCAKAAPDGGSPFTFWHPKLVTLHVWLWYHNPAGLYNGTNPLVQPFN
jgi:hypothetical protein